MAFRMSGSARRRSFLSLLAVAAQAIAAPALAADEPAAGEEPAAAPSAVDAAEETTDRCIDTHTRSQQLERDDKFLESRAALLECSAESCPGAIRTDSVRWLEDLRSRIPTVVFRANKQGQAVSNVEIYVDDTLVFRRLEGKALELNPGVYRVRFAPPSPAEPIEQELIVSQGDRLRDVSVELAPVPVPVPDRPVASEATERPVPIITYVLGGIGIAAAVNGGAWGVSSWSATGDLDASCAPRCDSDLVDVARRRALIADVSWGISAGAMIGAALTYFLRPEVAAEGAQVDVAVIDQGVLSRIRIPLD
jgi:hypothetical protein